MKSKIDKIQNWLSIAYERKTNSDGKLIRPALDEMMRVNTLMEEEVKELNQAYLNGDLIEMRDAIIDIFYILNNYMFIMNYNSNLFEQDFEEIYQSNMSKYCKTEAEAEMSVSLYGTGSHPDKLNQEIPCYYKKSNSGLYIIYRKLDNKIMKSYKYKPAKLK